MTDWFTYLFFTFITICWPTTCWFDRFAHIRSCVHCLLHNTDWRKGHFPSVVLSEKVKLKAWSLTETVLSASWTSRDPAEACVSQAAVPALFHQNPWGCLLTVQIPALPSRHPELESRGPQQPDAYQAPHGIQMPSKAWLFTAKGMDMWVQPYQFPQCLPS